MSRDTLVRALAEPGLQSSFCPSPHTHTLRDCARLRVPLHPPSSDVHLASHLLGGKIHALEQTASLPLFSLPHFPRQGLCTCRLPPGCTPPLLFLRSLGCCPHHVAETASLKVSLFPNTDFFFVGLILLPSPSAQEAGPSLQPSLLRFLSSFCSCFSIIPSPLLMPLPSFLGCFVRPRVYLLREFASGSLRELPPAILALVLAPWMPSDTPNSPCPPYSPAVGFLPFCHTDFSLKRLASPCPFVTRLLFQALNVSGRRSGLMPESLPAPTVQLACHL